MNKCVLDIAATKTVKQLELGRVLKMILDPETQLTIYNLLLHPDKLEIEDKIGKGRYSYTIYTIL